MKHVFVTVGTDHHPFDRLVQWADAWVAGHAPGEVSCLVQHGSAGPPVHATGVPFMKRSELLAAFDQADVVVTHGGPATVLEAEKHHHTPLCIPRDPRLGEHVDEHQVRFSRVLARRGRVHLAADRSAFMRFLEHEVTRRPGGEADGLAGGAPDGLSKLVDVVGLVTQDRRRRP